MNINFTLSCDTCSEHTNVRFGMSNRDVQPVRFACQNCGSAIDIVMGGAVPGVTGATRLQGLGPFDKETNFVDLHLDFPVSFEPYEMGMTPFMRASMRIGHSEMQLHSARLNHLNAEMENARFFETILKLYAREKFLPFKLNIERTFGIEVKSDRPEDRNAALYLLIAHMMMAYEYPNQSRAASDRSFEVLMEAAKNNKPAVDDFVREITDNKFLKNLQIDVLEIYPRMLAAELVIRPALFLDFDEDYENNPIPMRVSASEFDKFKDLYKDISEIISRQFVLVAGVNNLLKRGDSNRFTPRLNNQGVNKAPANLHKYADIVFGLKGDDLDGCWHTFLDNAVSNHLRNAIAHYKAEYDDVTQMVTYYPKKEGMAQDQAEQIYLIEFVRRLLTAYREMHRLHHLIKCLFYYRYLHIDRQGST